MSSRTPIQKSISEIEAMITVAIKEGKIDEMRGLSNAHNIITDNLQYERSRIIEDFEQGEREGMNAMQGLPKDWKSASDYYTKTYEP